MDFVYLLLISIALSMDCFAISICISSISKIKDSDYLKIPLHFTIFHILMLFTGYYTGNFFRKIIQGFDHWIAFILLTTIGIKIIIDSIQTRKKVKRPSSERRLLLLSLATSIDALAIGITIAFSNSNINYVALLLGFTVLTMSALGLLLGEKLHKLNLKHIGILGGATLIIIGIKTLLTHML